jgi:histone-lysine N-methyltransferase SETMAR
MIVHAENADPHLAKCVTESMDYNELKRVLHPPYSPDLAPSAFYLFGHVKHQLQGHEFTEGAELVSAISEILTQIPTDTLVDVFDDKMRRSQRCMDIIGESVE